MLARSRFSLEDEAMLLFMALFVLSRTETSLVLAMKRKIRFLNRTQWNTNT